MLCTLVLPFYFIFFCFVLLGQAVIPLQVQTFGAMPQNLGLLISYRSKDTHHQHHRQSALSSGSLRLTVRVFSLVRISVVEWGYQSVNPLLGSLAVPLFFLSFFLNYRFLPLCNPWEACCFPFLVAALFFLLAAANFLLPDGVDFNFAIVADGAYTSPVSEDFFPDGVLHF